MYAPTGEDRYKVYIIDEAHMLTREAWNALLKILEEPPPRVVFVFATTEPQKIAQAAAPVLSRVQRVRSQAHRAGGGPRTPVHGARGGEDRRRRRRARHARPRRRWLHARRALAHRPGVVARGGERRTAERVREALGLVAEDEYVALLDMVADHRAGDVFAAVGRLADLGVDFGLLLAGLADLLRAQLAISLGGRMPDLAEHVRVQLEERKERLTSGDLLRMLTMIGELEPHFRRSAQQQLLLETLLVRFALLDRTVELEDVLRGLGGTAPGGGGGVRRDIAPAAAPHRGAKGPSILSDAPRSAVAAPLRAAPALVAEPAAPPLADRSPHRRPREQVDLNRLVERWDRGDRVRPRRGDGPSWRRRVAEATPSAVTAGGVVTIGVASDALGQAIENAGDAIVAALRTVFDGVERVAVQVVAGGQGAPRRMTAEDVIADRVAMLRKRDPLLDAAIEGLDLRLIE